jgi:low affinity Fe/Cu permease
MAMKKIQSGFFDRLASHISRIAGLPLTFFVAITLVLIWAASGPIFDYSEVWQLVINTSTTIITFLLLFVVQNTQNRDTMALQIKLDSIIYVLTGCDNHLVKAEDMTLKELEALLAEYKKHAQDESLPKERAARFTAIHKKLETERDDSGDSAQAKPRRRSKKSPRKRRSA